MLLELFHTEDLSVSQAAHRALVRMARAPFGFAEWSSPPKVMFALWDHPYGHKRLHLFEMQFPLQPQHMKLPMELDRVSKCASGGR